jgi:hypothetical protein
MNKMLCKLKLNSANFKFQPSAFHHKGSKADQAVLKIMIIVDIIIASIIIIVIIIISIKHCAHQVIKQA